MHNHSRNQLNITKPSAPLASFDVEKAIGNHSKPIKTCPLSVADLGFETRVVLFKKFYFMFVFKKIYKQYGKIKKEKFGIHDYK